MYVIASDQYYRSWWGVQIGLEGLQSHLTAPFWTSEQVGIAPCLAWRSKTLLPNWLREFGGILSHERNMDREVSHRCGGEVSCGREESGGRWAAGRQRGTNQIVSDLPNHSKTTWDLQMDDLDWDDSGWAKFGSVQIAQFQTNLIFFPAHTLIIMILSIFIEVSFDFKKMFNGLE